MFWIPLSFHNFAFADTESKFFNALIIRGYVTSKSASEYTTVCIVVKSCVGHGSFFFNRFPVPQTNCSAAAQPAPGFCCCCCCCYCWRGEGLVFRFCAHGIDRRGMSPSSCWIRKEFRITDWHSWHMTYVASYSMQRASGYPTPPRQDLKTWRPTSQHGAVTYQPAYRCATLYSAVSVHDPMSQLGPEAGREIRQDMGALYFYPHVLWKQERQKRSK